MKYWRPRFKTRALLIAVVMVAIGLWGWKAHGRWSYCRERAVVCRATAARKLADAAKLEAEADLVRKHVRKSPPETCGNMTRLVRTLDTAERTYRGQVKELREAAAAFERAAVRPCAPVPREPAG